MRGARAWLSVGLLVVVSLAAVPATCALPLATLDEQGDSLAGRSLLQAPTTEDVAAQINQVQAALSARLPLVLSLAGPQAADLGTLMRRMLGDLMAFATKPIRLNFEEVAQGEDLAPRLQPSAARQPAATHGLVLDQPLTTSQWSGLTNAGVQVLQLPMLVRPLSLTYLGSTRSTPLRMAPCNLARLMRGEMTSWNDPQLQADNPDLRLPAKPIRLVLPGGPEAAGWRVLQQYVAATCPSQSVPSTPPNTGLSPAEVASQIWQGQVAPSNTIALLSPAWAELYSSLGVQQAVLLPVGAAAGGWVSATQFLPQAYSAQLQYLYERGQLPRDPSADWSGVVLAGQAVRPGSAPLYPLIRADYLVLAADLSALGEAGAALKGVVQYAFQKFQTSQALADQGTAAAALPPALITAGSEQVAQRLLLAPGTLPWLVAPNTRALLPGQSGAFLLAFTPTSTYQDLAHSDLAVAQSGTNDLDLRRQLQSAQDRANLAFNIAVASIVLGLLLSTLSLSLVAVALRRDRRKLSETEMLSYSSNRHQVRDGRNRRHGVSLLFPATRRCCPSQGRPCRAGVAWFAGLVLRSCQIMEAVNSRGKFTKILGKVTPMPANKFWVGG